MDNDRVNGMRLPERLLSAMRDGSWTSGNRRWRDVFPADEVVHPKLYSLELMRSVNERWRTESHPAYVGVADGRASPGDLSPARSLLIGELQGDAMIALDYRNGGDAPSVAFLNVEGRWAAVATSFDDFWRRLGSE